MYLHWKFTLRQTSRQVSKINCIELHVRRLHDNYVVCLIVFSLILFFLSYSNRYLVRKKNKSKIKLRIENQSNKNKIELINEW